MSVKKTMARSAIVGALGFSALGLGVGLGTASADHGNGGQPCWLQNCQGDQRGDGGQVTRETVATVANGGTSGDRINGGPIRVAGTSGHGISAASTTPVGTISPSTGRGNVLSRTSTTTAVPGDSGSWASGSRCDLSG